MKILFVCQQYIHSARWINQLKDSNHEIFVFDCLDRPVHEELSWTNYIGNWSKRKLPYIKGEDRLKKTTPNFYSKIEGILKVTPSNKLCKIIEEIQPDLVHSLEMQSQTYNVLKAYKKFDFKWAYFCWGSDLYFYESKKYHSTRIKQVLTKLNYLFTDNQRDVNLAKSNDFKGKSYSKLPGGGGYDLEYLAKFRKPFSQRNLILIKGYDHWAGKSIKVLEALENILESIKKYDIYVYSAHDSVIKKINELNTKHNISIKYSSRKEELNQEELLKLFGKAKIAIGNSITDGIPNTLLEAILSGAFPIQSNPGKVTEEYIIDGENGLLINDPKSSKEIAKQIKKALINDELLKNAFSINQEIAKKLDHNLIKKEVLKAYKQIEADV